MDEPLPLRESLEKLPVLLNTVLIQIGKVFRVPPQDSKTGPLNGMKSPSQQAIPQANSQFHEALDDIEIGLLEAKSVLERDLLALRAKRAERERAAGVTRLKKSGQANLKSDAPSNSGLMFTNSGHSSFLPEEQSASLKPHEAIMEDKGSSGQPRKPKLQSEPGDTPLEDSIKGSTNSKEPPTRDIETIASTKSVVSPTQILAQGTPSNQHDTTQLNDADFDSMFADTSTANPNDTLPFELDFSVDASISQELLDDNPFGELTANADFSTTSNEDLNTLLPGLENYVNGEAHASSVDDFAMIDLTDASNEFNSSKTNKKALGPATKLTSAEAINASSGPDSHPAATMPMESSFDDLFYGSGDMGLEDSTMVDANLEVLEDFDDDWFNTDGT